MKKQPDFIFCCYAGAFFIPFILMIIILSITGICHLVQKPFSRQILKISMSSFSLISEKFIKETIVSFILFPKHSGVKCSAYMPITLMSPLNIILLFFRTEWLPQAIELLILIKISLCSLTFYF